MNKTHEITSEDPAGERIPSPCLATARLDRETAERLARTLGDSEDDLAEVVSCFEDKGEWTLEVYLAGPEQARRMHAAAERIAGGRIAFRIEAMPERDWVAHSLEGLSPVAAGRFVVHGAHDRARVPDHAIGIEVEAGMAFGTGHHATTLGCLMVLEERMRRRPRPRRVLDVGTGTGLLAIAAARGLRAAVTASDIDPVSTRIARENARANAAGPRLRVATAPGTDHAVIRAGAPYDLVFANILAGPLIALAPDLEAVLAPSGALVLSGLLTRQERPVLAAYRRAGLVPARRVRLGEWSTLVVERPGTRKGRRKRRP